MDLNLTANAVSIANLTGNFTKVTGPGVATALHLGAGAERNIRMRAAGPGQSHRDNLGNRQREGSPRWRGVVRISRYFRDASCLHRGADPGARGRDPGLCLRDDNRLHERPNFAI